MRASGRSRSTRITVQKIISANESMSMTDTYVLAYSASEIARLKLNADVIAGVTRRLIRDSGIQPGMRALDIGCGVGDVSMLLDETFGKRRRLVAFDREPRHIGTAQLMAIEAGHDP